MNMKQSLCLTYSLYRCLKSNLIKRLYASNTSFPVRCLSVHSRQTFPETYNSTSRCAISPHAVNTTLRFHSSQQCQYRIVQPGKVSPIRDVPDHIVKPSYVASKNKFKRPKHAEIKSDQQIAGMRASCELGRKILDYAGQQLKVGMTTDEIDKLVHEMSINNNAYPSPLRYRGFQKSVCTSVNNVLCHGIPDDSRLEDGDIINIDITVFYNGFHGDVSETFLIGSVDEGGRRLVETARKCCDAGVEACHPGARLCEIGNAINEAADRYGFAVVPVFCGHGIGEYFHGPPDIFHMAHEDDEVMKSGMTFTIEPIISEGSTDIKILDDGWTAVTVDNSRSAQFEHTVLITDSGVEVLTAPTPS